ncbi:MAG: transglutaminase-like domain-containing protein, partial [Acidobacteriota bacterium]|nr:transglutaminase-like domain-containing protein [Acidobacteriota bacterium]
LKNRVWGMFDRLRTARFDKRFTYWALIMLLACLPWIFKPDLQHLLPEFGPIFGGGGTGSGGSGSQVQTLNNALRNWGGSIIDSPTGEGYEWDFSYIGPAKIFFRMGTFSRYDPARGFFPGNGGRLTTYPDFIDRGEAKVAVSLGVSGGGSLVLPLPPGYVLVKSSISGLSGFPVAQNQFGEPVIQNLPEIDFTLGYTAIKRAFPIQPPPMTSANPGEWPAEYRDLIDSARAIDAGAAVNMFSLFIRSRFAYTDRRELASIFHSHPGSWLQKTIGTGAGDCDILNGLLVLMMRSAGHQAFLSVGLVGDNGRARPTLHAWARYYHNGWQSIDITEHAVALSSLVAGTTTGGQAEELLPSLLNNLPGPTPGADPSEGIESENPGVGNAGEGPFSYWLLPLAVLVAFCAWFFLRRREHIAESDKPAFITDLFEHYFYHGRDDMDLQLKFRPVFPLLSGGKISLFEMQQQVDSGTLLSGRGDDRLLPLLADGYQVLNVDSPVVANLIGFLPTMTWLHDFEAIASGHQRHPNLVAAEGVIRELDASFRVYQVPKTDEFTEARLRFADEGMGEHHILVGEEHPVFKKLTATVGADMDLQVFQAVQLLLNKTTFYLNEKNLFLERLARRAPGWSGARMQGAFQ